MEFNKALAIGRRQIAPLGFNERDNYILSLSELQKVVPPEKEFYEGLREIPVEYIIGTENRASDYSYGFFPVKRWMAEHWELIRELMLSQKLNEAIDVLEYGGHFFVRDGNHRVSVAKTNGIEFLSANVRSYYIPVNLCPRMDRSKISAFREKYWFYRETKAFDVLPENRFHVALPETWLKLKDVIYGTHKQYFVNTYKYEPDNETLLKNFNIEIYDSTIKHIQKHALTTICPGKEDTDIFCDIMFFWRTMPDRWFQEVYDLFVAKAKRKHFLRNILSKPFHKISYLFMPVRKERELFFIVSKLKIFRPKAHVPDGGKRYYRFLREQIIKKHFYFLKKQYNRHPHMKELTGHWYDNIFKPTLHYYEQSSIKQEFPKFYIKFMKRYYSCIIKNLEENPDILETKFLKYKKNSITLN